MPRGKAHASFFIVCVFCPRLLPRHLCDVYCLLIGHSFTHSAFLRLVLPQPLITMAESRNESSEVIKNNDRAMKTVILYEALQKKPIFGSYRRFCALVGQDAMEFPDFEFWYYRFYHGQTDFYYDRSMNPVPKTIMDMPVSLIYKITENLDPVDKAYLRTMNKSLKDVVDSRAPVFEKINIHGSDDYLNWSLNDKRFECFKKENACIFFTPNEESKSDKSFVQKSLEYLSPLFKIPKIQVNHLSIAVLDRMTALNYLLPVPFHVKSVELYAFNMNQVFPFLSALIPGELESINLKAIQWLERDQISRIFETEQFKQSKHVQLKGRLNEEDLVRFSHLKSFKCELNSFEHVDVLRIRDIISPFEQLESCELMYYDVLNRFPIRFIAQTLGEEVPFGPLKTIKHSYPIPESNEHLEFEMDTGEYHCTIKIHKIR
ncbi:hypothetical protein B9Z55_026903 [Caenorhabditis nigoni]|uniref:F-box domain-containing protein n=1 Tax=Caenorhabditis nigoni TaxID=1611254 RepID=A0A2G5SHT1_9PELO|nr:hypothetical protein B9Z55_026903 [Caenorhabditis nigoni]